MPRLRRRSREDVLARPRHRRLGLGLRGGQRRLDSRALLLLQRGAEGLHPDLGQRLLEAVDRIRRDDRVAVRAGVALLALVMAAAAVRAALEKGGAFAG